MSQLRNLLTNKVIAHKTGSMSHFRKHLRAHGRNLRSVREEIAERAELKESQRTEQKVQSAVQKLTVLGRVSRFLRRMAKGA